MDKKTEKEYSKSDNEEKKPIIKQIYDFVRANWLPLLGLVIIALLTIIVVPIVYNIGKSNGPDKDLHLSWNVTGKTIVDNATTFPPGATNTFGLISSIKFDNNDNLFILDKTKNRLFNYSLPNIAYIDYDAVLQSEPLHLFAGYLNGTPGMDQMSFNQPNDFCIDLSSNTIYVADTQNHRIQSITSANSPATTVCGTTGTPGSSLTTLNQPMSVTMGGDPKTLYIADYGNNRIVSCDITNFQLTVVVPSTASNRNQYIYTPISIKFDSSSSTLVIAQQLGYNVVRWNFGSGNTLGNWSLIAGSASSELSGTSRTLFNALCYVEIHHTTEMDYTFVVDCNNQRIQVYQGDLTKGKTIAGVIQASGDTIYLFNNPNAIAFDSNMNLYVADTGNYRVQRFEQLY